MVRYILREKAFSLLEVSISMGIMALLASAIVPTVIRDVEIKAAEKTIVEIGIIQQAAKKFYQDRHAWPSSLGQLQQEAYVSPLWSLKNPWNHEYQISVDANTLSVSVEVPVNLVEMLKQRLPAASSAGQMVTSVVGVLSANDNVPSGAIVVWSGMIANIPDGWVLCDGNNGTPDLRDKFIVGAREDEGGVAKSKIMGFLAQAGGAIAHDHGGETKPHTLTIAQMPKHHHGYMATPWTGGRYDGHSSPLMTQQVSGVTDDEGGSQPHTHLIGSDFNVPPYYALAYIMKL